MANLLSNTLRTFSGVANMTDSFSTPDTHAFEHPELSALAANAEAGPSSLSNGTAVADLSIEEAFEVDDTVQRILDGGYKTVS